MRRVSNIVKNVCQTSMVKIKPSGFKMIALDGLFKPVKITLFLLLGGESI